MTPKFSSLIDFIAVAVDVFMGRSRKKVFSELKTFSAKQVYFSDLFEQIKSELNLTDPEMDFLSQSLIKVENILSHLKSTPLYTDVSQHAGSTLFFDQFTVPFVKQMCGLSLEHTESVFFNRLDKILFDGKRCNDLKGVISLLKSEISSELNHIDASSGKELKIAVAKLDTRSFLSRSSIKKHIDILHQNISTIDSEDKADSVSSNIQTIFLAAKVAFYFAKYKESNYADETTIDYEIEGLFLSFNTEYTFNTEVSSDDDSYIKNAKFVSCKKYFLDRINQENPVSFFKKYGTKALWEYKGGIFNSYAVKEQLLWDINKGRYSENGVNHFIKNVIPELNKRQSGTDGVDIAVNLMGLKVLLSKSITNNSLEPLINFLIDNLEKHNLINFIVGTPFGSFTTDNLTASEINIALAIRSFNERILNGVINIEFCNPLLPLNEVLEIYFEKGSLTNKQIGRKPIKTETITLYDALRNINYYILAFGLQENTRVSSCGFVNVLTSKFGSGINKYLSLHDTDKKNILELISPEEFILEL
tara:strand:- start:4166 stop:5764 length:1599 start_codon:yes stop_codon:yes gene_type:complete